MPVQVIPPMYRMLADEIKWAVEEVISPLTKLCVMLIHGQNEPFNFKYYLIVARTYHLSPEELDNLGQNPDRSKRRKGQVSGNGTPCFFHPEDEQFQQVSLLLCLQYLSLSARGVGVNAFHPLSIRECSTKRGGCLWARHPWLLNVGPRREAVGSGFGHARPLSPLTEGHISWLLCIIPYRFCSIHGLSVMSDGMTRSYLVLIPIFKLAPTTSTSFHLDPLVACFLLWIYTSVFLKCLVIISGVCTPSIRPGGARCDGWTSGDEMLSMLDVISSTKLFTNFGVT